MPQPATLHCCRAGGARSRFRGRLMEETENGSASCAWRRAWTRPDRARGGLAIDGREPRATSLGFWPNRRPGHDASLTLLEREIWPFASRGRGATYMLGRSTRRRLASIGLDARMQNQIMESPRAPARIAEIAIGRRLERVKLLAPRRSKAPGRRSRDRRSTLTVAAVAARSELGGAKARRQKET